MNKKSDGIETLEISAEYTKQQVLKAKRYSDKTDLLSAVLVDGVMYTLDSVDKLIGKFLERRVR